MTLEELQIAFQVLANLESAGQLMKIGALPNDKQLSYGLFDTMIRGRTIEWFFTEADDSQRNAIFRRLILPEIKKGRIFFNQWAGASASSAWPAGNLSLSFT